MLGSRAFRPGLVALVIGSVFVAAVGCFSDDNASPPADAGTLFDAGDATVPDTGMLPDVGTTFTDSADDQTAPDAADGGDAAETAPPVVHGVYVTSTQSPSLLAFAVADGGALGAQRIGSPFSTGGLAAESVTGNGAGTRIYAGVQTATGGGVTAFTLDATGNVGAQQSGSPFATNVNATPTCSVLNPAGTRLYVIHQGSTGSIAVFGVDATGNLTGLRTGSPFTTGSGTYSAVLNSAGTRLYVMSQESHGVFVFGLDANGDVLALRPGSPFLTGLGDAPVLGAVHPSGNRLYVTDQGGALIVYTLDATGDISGQATGSPFSGVTDSFGIALNAAGTHAYVGDLGTAALKVFPLDGTTGDVTGAAVPFSTGVSPFNLAFGLAPTHLFVMDENGSSLADVTLNASGDPQSALTPFADGGIGPSGIYAR